MNNVLRATWPLFLGVALLMVGNGLQGTLLGLRATFEGFSTETTGFIMSLYYGGYLAGCVLAPRLIGNVGHIRVFTALASLASTAALIHGLFVDPVFWGLARVITGFCFAVIYIVIESWINDIATNETRGRIMGAYLLTFYGAMVFGQYALNLAPPQQIELFIMISVLISLSLMPICLSKRPAPDYKAPAKISLGEVYRASPLGVTAVTLTGFASGIIFSIAPVYATQSGMNVAQIANFMAFFLIGGMSAQVPMGYLSDHMGRRKLIIVVSSLAGVAAAGCFMVSGTPLLLNMLFLLLGIVGLSIYGVGAAYTNDHLRRDQYVAATAKLILANGAGAFAGPFVTALFMGHFGPQAFFPLVAAIFFCITLFAFYRASVSPPRPVVEAPAPFVPLSPGGITALEDDNAARD